MNCIILVPDEAPPPGVLQPEGAPPGGATAAPASAVAPSGPVAGVQTAEGGVTVKNQVKIRRYQGIIEIKNF